MSKNFIALFNKIQQFRDFVDPDNDAAFDNLGNLSRGTLEGGSFSLNRAAMLSSLANVYPRSLTSIVNEHVEPNSGGSGGSNNDTGSGQGSDSDDFERVGNGKAGTGVGNTSNLDGGTEVSGVEEVTGGGKCNVGGGDNNIITDIDIADLEVGDTIIVGTPPNTQICVITKILPPNSIEVSPGLTSPPLGGGTGPFDVKKKTGGGGCSFGNNGETDLITGIDTSDLEIGDTLIVGEFPNTIEVKIVGLVPPDGVRVQPSLTTPPLNSSGTGGDGTGLKVEKKNSTENSDTGVIDLNEDAFKICGLDTSTLSIGDTIVVGGNLDSEIQTRVITEILGGSCVKVGEAFTSGTTGTGTKVRKVTSSSGWYYSNLWGDFWISSKYPNWIWSNKYLSWIYIGLLQTVGGKPYGPVWFSNPGKWYIVGGGKVVDKDGSELGDGLSLGQIAIKPVAGHDDLSGDLEFKVGQNVSDGGFWEIENLVVTCPPGLNKNKGNGGGGNGSGDDDSGGGDELLKLFHPVFGWFLWNGVSRVVYFFKWGVWLSFPGDGEFDPFNIGLPAVCKIWNPDGGEGDGSSVVTLIGNPPSLERPSGELVNEVNESVEPIDEVIEKVGPPGNIKVEGSTTMPAGWFQSPHFGLYYMTYPWIYSAKWNGWWYIGELGEEGHGTVGWVYFGTTQKWYWLMSPNIYKVTSVGGGGDPSGNDALDPEDFEDSSGSIEILSAFMTDVDATSGTATVSFSGQHKSAGSRGLLLYRLNGSSWDVWENFGTYDENVLISDKKETGSSAAPGQKIKLRWGGTDIYSEEFEIEINHSVSIGPVVGGGDPPPSSGGGSEAPGSKENTDVAVVYPKIFTHPIFGICIVMQAQDPLTYGWFYTLRYGWIWGDSSQDWFYIVNFSDWFWFGSLIGNGVGDGWVYSQSKKSWWWNSFGNFTNEGGEDYFSSGSGSFVNTNPVGGTGEPGDSGGTEQGNLTEEKYLVAANGEEITLANGNSILIGDGESAPADTSDTVDNSAELLVADKIQNVLTYKTITDADGSIQIPDQVEVIGGEIICADIMLENSTTSWLTSRVLDASDILQVYNLYYGSSNHGFTGSPSDADGGYWFGRTWGELQPALLSDARYYEPPPVWELDRVLSAADVTQAYDLYMTPHGFTGSTSDADGGGWVGLTWGDLKTGILNAYYNGDFRYENNCYRIQLEPENTSILLF